MMLEVRAVKNQDEAEIAFAIANRSFGAEGVNIQENQNKKAIWFSEPSYSLNNIIVAMFSERIIGVVRIVPKIVCRNEIQYSVAGFTSICIDKPFRDKGISVSLMEGAIAITQERGFDLAMLVARKAVDHYYVQFGFHGISSYEKVAMEAISVSEEEMNFEPAGDGLIPFYSSCYDENYSECFGAFLRSHAQWKFILHLIFQRKDMEALTILFKGEVIGYCFIQDKKICEIAALPKFSLITILFNLKLLDKIKAADDWLDIPSNHLLVRNCRGRDIRIQRRECSYGGHMARVLQYKKLAIDYAKRTGKSFDHLSDTNGNISHENLCRLLGCWTMNGDFENRNVLPFNLNYMDQF